MASTREIVNNVNLLQAATFMMKYGKEVSLGVTFGDMRLSSITMNKNVSRALQDYKRILEVCPVEIAV